MAVIIVQRSAPAKEKMAILSASFFFGLTLSVPMQRLNIHSGTMCVLSILMLIMDEYMIITEC